MNILYAMIYAPEKGGSGAPIYTHNLMKGLTERGDKAGIVYSVHHSYTPSHDTPYKLYPLFFDRPPIFDNQPKATSSVPFRLMTLEQVIRYVSAFYTTFEKLVTKEKYEMIHIQHGMYVGYAASLIKEKYGTPYMISLHAMELNFLHEFPDPIFAMKAMIDADGILALSEAQKKRLLAEYTKERIIELDMQKNGFTRLESEARYLYTIGDKEIDPDCVAVCPLGIDTDHYTIRTYTYADGVTHLASLDNSKIVMYAARLIEMKGIKNLLEAEKIYNKDGDVYTVVIGGGELEGYVKNIAKKRKNVYYLGFKEQALMPFYLNFIAEYGGVFTVPSSSEGMSLVYLEAMACGARVIASCKKDMAAMDFMQPPFARFAEFGNIEELAETITQILNEKPVERFLVRKNVEQYNLSNFQQRVYALYELLLN